MKKLWGLLEYKPQWTLTLRGWSIVLFFLTVVMFLIVTQIQPFLAVSSPIKADVLVVEGWVEDNVVTGAIAEFEQDNYKLLITTGSPLSRGTYLSAYKSFAQLAAATAIALGLPSEKVVAIPTPPVKINRTLASAIEVRQWLSQSPLNIHAINVYSYDVHTRRSWLIFKQVLAPKIEVGAIAHPPPDYDPKQWWISSAGVRSILSEAIAYLYFRLVGTP